MMKGTGQQRGGVVQNCLKLKCKARWQLEQE
jgi:hypothetical protein